MRRASTSASPADTMAPHAALNVQHELLRARELCLLGDYDTGLPAFRRALQHVQLLQRQHSAPRELHHLLLELESEYMAMAQYHATLEQLSVAVTDMQLTKQRRRHQEESRQRLQRLASSTASRDAALAGRREPWSNSPPSRDGADDVDDESDAALRRWQKPRAAARPATNHAVRPSASGHTRERKLPSWANKRESQSMDATSQATSRFSSRSMLPRKPALPAAARASSHARGKENAHRNSIKRSTTSVPVSKVNGESTLRRSSAITTTAGATARAKRRESDQSSASSVSEAVVASSTIAGRTRYSDLAKDGGWVDQELIEAIERDIVDQGERVTFDDIAGLEATKQLLQETVMLPQIAPHLFEDGLLKPCNGVLMFGPPGTGKTLLAKAVAHECGTTFFNVSASTLSSKYRGDSEKMVRILFDMARYYEPAIIFMDEIDAIASARGAATEHEASRRVKTELLVQINGVSSGEHDGARVMLLAATNLPWELDEAMRRRLTKRVYIPLPEASARRALFALNLRRVELAPDVAVDDLVRETQGYSGDDITSVCETAKRMPVKRVYTPGLLMELSRQDQEAGDELRNLLEKKRLVVTKSDFAEALRNVSKSVGHDQLARFEAWETEFGSK